MNWPQRCGSCSERSKFPAFRSQDCALYIIFRFVPVWRVFLESDQLTPLNSPLSETSCLCLRKKSLRRTSKVFNAQSAIWVSMITIDLSNWSASTSLAQHVLNCGWSLAESVNTCPECRKVSAYVASARPREEQIRASEYVENLKTQEQAEKFMTHL